MEPEHSTRVTYVDTRRDGKLQIARALAIEEYAKVESSLAHLLALALDTTSSKASIIFFNIVSTRARNTIISSLISDTYDGVFDTYWEGEKGNTGRKNIGGLFTLIRQLDDKRNQIVHWHTSRHLVTNEEEPSGIREELRPGHYWARGWDSEPLFTKDLYEFCAKARFVSESIGFFNLYHVNDPDMPPSSLMTDEARDTWRQIFEQPVLYPPPDTHPLSPNYKAPDSPPPASEA